MWTFVPRLPRQIDWETRRFKWTIYSIKQLIEDMNSNKTQGRHLIEYRGQLIIKDAKTSDEITISGSNSYFIDDELIFPFNNHGYFLQQKIEAKKLSLL